MKKLSLLLLAAVMVFNLTACGGTAKDEEKFYIYSWNTELNERLGYVYDAYPELRDRICYVNVGSSNAYQSRIIDALRNENAEEYPDMIALESGYLMKGTQSDALIPVTELGITSEDMGEMYPYTIEAATDTETSQVKALSWQACPGGFLYRRSLAKKYLGTDDPCKVQEKLADWDAFLDTAKKIKRNSKDVTRILGSTGEISNVFWSNKKQSYIQDGKLVLDDSIDELFRVSFLLNKDRLTRNEYMWSDQWTTYATTNSVFGYFGSTWFLHWILKPNCGGEKVGSGTYGDWAICQGPEPYYWGGTWVGATKGCSDKELAGKLMKALTCDEEILKKMSDGTLDYVNNKKVMEELSAEGKGQYEFLNGQDYIATFEPLVDKVDVSFMSPYDSEFNDIVLEEIDNYTISGESIEEAKEAVTRRILERYPELGQ